MGMGFIYWHPIIYRNMMRVLYGRYFYSRYKTITDLLPEDVTVIDVCCGDCYMSSFLAKKKIDYLGLDFNPKFIKYALRKKIKAELFDLNSDVLPKADYIIMQGSLYQFVPRHELVMNKLFCAAKKGLIISEPIENVASSANSMISFLASLTTRIKGKNFPYRFDKEELLDLFYRYNVSFIKEIKGGRDLVGFFIKNPCDQQ